MKYAMICTAICISTMYVATLQAKEIIPTPKDTPVLGEFEPILIKAMMGTPDGKNSRKNNTNANLKVDPDGSFATVRHDKALQSQLKKHKFKLLGGPMLGCVTPKSARIWVRTLKEAKVQVSFTSSPKYGDAALSKVVRTVASNDFVALIDLENLAPFTEFFYNVHIDGKPFYTGKLPSFRTAPKPGQNAKFDVAFGGGARVNPVKEVIWNTVASFKPAMFLFLGDNTYSDDPTHRNRQRLYYYRRQLRPEFQRLTASTACYSIWDDHDFGVNDSSGGLDPFKPAWKVPVWKVFKENWNNPAYGGGPKNPGCYYNFTYGDVEFFMTDGRYYRSFKDGTMLGPVQKQWLLTSLKASKATFKVIASGTLWTETADKGGKDSWWGVKKEREQIFSLIDNENIGGVILTSADRHRTDIYKIKRPNGYDLYEFETSKLTNNHTHGTKTQALFSYNKGNFFGMLTFDTTPADPTVTFRCITVEGKTVHTFTLKRSQLQKN
jgi:alkaline phosphatase D